MLDEGGLTAVGGGHGSPEYLRSQMGAELACAVSADKGLQFLSCVAPQTRERVRVVQAQLLCQQIHQSWLLAVRDHHSQYPFPLEQLATLPPLCVEQIRARPETAYGSTLLVAIAWSTGLVALQLGDGDILHSREGKSQRLFDRLDRSDSLTDSLCDEAAVDKFQIVVDAFDLGAPQCVALRTDGWTNSFENWTGQQRADESLLEQIQASGPGRIESELPDFLTQMSALGWSQGDDISIAVMYQQNVSLQQSQQGIIALSTR